MLTGFNEATSDYANIKIKSNYHTHNYLCGHAGGTVCEFVEKAVLYGLEVIGISDHCASPLGTVEPYVTPDTLHALYLPQFDEARRLYSDDIEILSAVEIEYFPNHDEYYSKLLKNLDYLVMGQHEYLLDDGTLRNSFGGGVDEENVIAYCENVKLGLKSKKFALLAHPDLIFYRKPVVTKKIAAAFESLVKTAVDNGVALELNANGIRNHDFRYPTDLLISLCKKYAARVVVSSDSHSPNELVDECLFRLYAYAKAMRLNLVDRII